MNAGIEAMNIYCGSAALNVEELAKVRKLDNDRFANLLMKEKRFQCLTRTRYLMA